MPLSLDEKVSYERYTIAIRHLESQVAALAPLALPPELLAVRLSFLINTLPGVYGPGDTAFVIPYGGTIFVRAADSAKGRFSEKSVDCTRSVTCSVAFP